MNEFPVMVGFHDWQNTKNSGYSYGEKNKLVLSASGVCCDGCQVLGRISFHHCILLEIWLNHVGKSLYDPPTYQWWWITSPPELQNRVYQKFNPPKVVLQPGFVYVALNVGMFATVDAEVTTNVVLTPTSVSYLPVTSGLLPSLDEAPIASHSLPPAPMAAAPSLPHHRAFLPPGSVIHAASLPCCVADP